MSEAALLHFCDRTCHLGDTKSEQIQITSFSNISLTNSDWLIASSYVPAHFSMVFFVLNV